MLPCFKAFIRAVRLSHSNEEGRLLSTNIQTDKAAVERRRNTIAHRMSRKEGWEKLFEDCNIPICPKLHSHAVHLQGCKAADGHLLHAVARHSTLRGLSGAAASFIMKLPAASGACMNRNAAATTGMCCRCALIGVCTQSGWSGSSGYRKQTLSRPAAFFKTRPEWAFTLRCRGSAFSGATGGSSAPPIASVGAGTVGKKARRSAAAS